MQYTFTVVITTQETYPLWLIQKKVERGFSCVNGCSDPDEMIKDYEVKVTDHKLELNPEQKNKLGQKEIHEMAMEMFRGERHVPDGATAFARKRCREFGTCSEVIISAYTDFIIQNELEEKK